MPQILMDVSDLEFTGAGYVCSPFGTLRLSTLILSLLAFICNESTPWCNGKEICFAPAYAPTYRYYGVVTFGVFFSSSLLFGYYCGGLHRKLPITFRKRLIIEFSYLSGAILFYIFGNVFMISRTGNRLSYIIATVFGCLTMSVLSVHLVFLVARFRFLFSAEYLESREQSLERIDHQSLPDRDSRLSLSTGQLTSIKKLTESPQPPIAVSSPKPNQHRIFEELSGTKSPQQSLESLDLCSAPKESNSEIDNTKPVFFPITTKSLTTVRSPLMPPTSTPKSKSKPHFKPSRKSIKLTNMPGDTSHHSEDDNSFDSDSTFDSSDEETGKGGKKKTGQWAAKINV